MPGIFPSSFKWIIHHFIFWDIICFQFPLCSSIWALEVRRLIFLYISTLLSKHWDLGFFKASGHLGYDFCCWQGSALMYCKSGPIHCTLWYCDINIFIIHWSVFISGGSSNTPQLSACLLWMESLIIHCKTKHYIWQSIWEFTMIQWYVQHVLHYSS